MIFNDPIPGCVPELCRARQEAADRASEKEMQAQEHYRANRQKLDDAKASGLPILPYGGYGDCRDCQDADHDTAASAEDDFGSVICHNPACPEHMKHQ